MAQLQSTVVSGNTSTTGFISAGGRKLSMGILDLRSDGTPTQFKIKTTIPWNSGGADFTVNIKGFRYGGPQMVSLSIGWHHYLNTFHNEKAISNGAWAPTITLAKSSDNYVVIHLAGPGYWPKLYVESLYSSSYTDSYASGWTWSDADLSDCTDVSVVPYDALACSITGNSVTTSQTNFSTLTLNSATVATQSWVQSQGYITGESDTLASVTGRGATTSTAVTFNGNVNANGTYFNVGGYIDLSGLLYLRSNVNYLNASSNGWNTFLARNGEGFDAYVSRVFSSSHISSTGGNIHTARGRVAFSSTSTDANHTIYNNYNNIDGEGSWDGMKMNVYNGLDVRTGNASGAAPSTVLQVRPGGLIITGTLAWNNATPMVNVGGSGDGRMQVRHIWGKEAGTANPDHLWLQYTNSSFGVQIGASGGTNPLYVAGDIYMNGYFSGSLVATRTWVQSQGYITGYTESDTLATVTARGATTGTATVFTNSLFARKSQTAGNYTTAALWTESYDNTTTGIAFHISGNVGKFLEMRTNGVLYWHGDTVWHSGNLTNLNQLTNGPGYVTGGPYLPLSGGTLSGQLTITGARLLVETGGSNTYGIVSGYNNNNHLMTMRAGVSGSTSSPTFTAGHKMTFVEYAEANDSTGWYFISSQPGTYTEVARITRTGINWNGNTVYHSGNLTNLNQLTNGPGYITSESDTLATVTGRGASTSVQMLQNGGRFVRDSHYRTISGVSDYYGGGSAGWYKVAQITLTGNCSGAVLFGTLNDNRYDGADAYQISVVARAECDFTSNNESHYINVGCSILGSTNYTNYRDKVRVLLVASSSGSRTYELQFYETPWNNDTWELQTTGWTIYSSPQAPGSSTGTARVNYISKQNSDYYYSNIAMYVNGNTVLHAGNYNSYSPTLTGGGASGTWGINITGNSATVTNGVYTTGAQSIGGQKTFTGNVRMQSAMGFDAGQTLYFGYEEGFGGSDTGGLDYGYITYDNNSSTYGTAGGETSALRIGTQNDGDGSVGDHIALEAAGNIYLRPGAWGGGGSVRVGTLSSFSTVWHSGNLTNLNQLTNGPGYITSAALGSYLPLSGGTLSGNLNIQTGNNPAHFLLRGTNSELYVDAGYGGGTARLIINRQGTGNQAALHFTTGATVTPGTAWNSTGAPLWTMGMTNSSQVNDFKIAYGDIYDAASVAVRIDTNKIVYFTNTPYVGGNIMATQSWVTSQGYLTSASGFATRQDGARYTTDFNSILSSGFFNAEAQPSNAPNSYGQLIVAKGIDTGLQIAGGYSSQQLYFRGWGYGPEANGFYPWRRLLNNGADPYAADMNQYVKTTSSPTFFANLYISADGSSGYVASRIWLYSHNNYRGAGVYLSGTGSTWFAGTGYTDFDGAYIISRRSVAGDDSTAWNNYRLWQVNSGGSTYQTGDLSAVNVHAYAATGKVVAGTWNFDGMLFDSSRSALIARGNYPHVELWSDVSNANHGGTLRFGGYDNGSSGAYKSWNIGAPGSDLYFLDVGYGGNNSNPHAGIAGLGAAYSYPGAFTIMRFHNNGNIGIGNFGTYGSEGNTPGYKLDVRGNGRFTSTLYANSTIDVGSGGDAINITGAQGRITFRDSVLTWTGYVGFRGNLGIVEFPGRNVQITSGYNGTVEINTGTNDYLSGGLTVPFGNVNARRGFISNDNPWGTSNSAFFPNGITTAGGTNWVYGFTYIGNAPSNGSGAEVASNGRFYFRNGNTSGNWGYAGLFVDRNSAANNYVPFSFESEYGNHSWGIVARFHIQTGGQDKPAIQFTSTGSNERWSLGYCSGSDFNFRITQNHGYRTDNSGQDGWGTERFKISTDGVTDLGLGSARVNFARHIDARDTWGSCGCTTAFLGWYGSKIMLGNGNSGGHDYGNARGVDTIISTNPHYFYSRIEANDVIRFQENDSRRIYGASVNGYNAVRVEGNWNTFDIMGRVLDWTGSNLHFGNGYNGVDHSSHYFIIGNPVSYFQVNGPIYATGDVIAYYSDRRLKQNIKPIDSALDIINNIGAYTFEWNKKSEEVWSKKEGDKDFGLISQEVEAVWPMGVAMQGGKDINDKYGYGDPNSEHYDPLHVEKNPEEYKTVRYDKMVTLAIAAIKEQQIIIKKQQAQIEELKSKLDGLTK
jgi:hypothetical protein